ncbi:sulfatase/phosphatase domain-containing protein [Portibacter marinus]|uniref:sulfatase/phosphatase domain-containing protein n=1 Tax=Portibacter marinus TaxID=2898660 RepID=UPI001F3045FC|nr:sulfatase/phosphatase domain-containing protein [Portibacter marinus]
MILKEDGMRTPIMYKWEGKIDPKMDEETFTSSLDIIPTLLELVGIPVPDSIDGINILDEEIRQKRMHFTGEIYQHDFNEINESLNYQIVYAQPYKLILPDSINKSGEEIQLYNVIEDPFEENELSLVLPEKLRELRSVIKN